MKRTAAEIVALREDWDNPLYRIKDVAARRGISGSSLRAMAEREGWGPKARSDAIRVSPVLRGFESLGADEVEAVRLAWLDPDVLMDELSVRVSVSKWGLRRLSEREGWGPKACRRGRRPFAVNAVELFGPEVVAKVREAWGNSGKTRECICSEFGVGRRWLERMAKEEGFPPRPDKTLRFYYALSEENRARLKQAFDSGMSYRQMSVSYRTSEHCVRRLAIAKGWTRDEAEVSAGKDGRLDRARRYKRASKARDQNGFLRPSDLRRVPRTDDPRVLLAGMRKLRRSRVRGDAELRRMDGVRPSIPGFDECQFPVDPRPSSFAYCRRPTVGGPYCAAHARFCYKGGLKRATVPDLRRLESWWHLVHGCEILGFTFRISCGRIWNLAAR